MVIEIGLDELMGKDVIFQNRGYEGWAIWKYIVEHEDTLPAEIFPAIFISVRKESGIKKIFRLAKGDCQTVIFNVMNVRDRFEIVDHQSEQSSRDDYFGKTNTRIEHISPDILQYPNGLGGGYCGGCPVVSYFREVVWSGEYNILSDADVVEQTKFIPYFIDLCKSSRCYDTYRSIVNDGYRLDLQENQMIIIDVLDGKYVPQEGKHRVCALKRYDYNGKIPARITYTSRSINQKSYFAVKYVPTDLSMDEYYKCYESYGLNRNDVLDYLTDQNKSLCKMIVEKQHI